MNNIHRVNSSKDISCHVYKKRILNVLIADDDMEVAYLLKQLLELRGHTVVVVEDGPRCISQCIDKKFDLIFIDYHMDGLNGSDVINILKNETNNIARNTLIFAYTGDNSNDALAELKTSGMNGAIVKPIDINALYALLRNIETRISLDSDIIRKELCSKDLILFDDILPTIY